MNVQLKAIPKPGDKKRAEATRKKDLERWKRERAAGCSCDTAIGYSSTDPRCPLHGLSEFRRDNYNDRR
jgi:hypothetical protein